MNHIIVKVADVPPVLVPKLAAIKPSDLEAAPFQDALPIPPRIRLDKEKSDTVDCRIVLRRKLVTVHSLLGKTTPAWSYDYQDEKGHWIASECYLGPTVVVRRGQTVTITYENQLTGTLPITPVIVDLSKDVNNPAVDDPQIANSPGRSVPVGTFPGSEKPGGNVLTPTDAQNIYGWGVIHLHGARTAAMYDGWTENAMLPPRTETEYHEDANGKLVYGKSVDRPGGTQVSVYENKQSAAMLWYHDHAMGVTSMMVASGLAGLYFIRDVDEEAMLAKKKIFLPEDEYEIPLVIQDRNLDDDNGNGLLTGKILHKVTSNTAEYFAPYTLVNGVIWPKMTVERRRYRFRVLNGSNARAYCLKAVTIDDQNNVIGEVPMDRFVRQIGSDGGLLAAPVTVPPGGLLIGSAERVDLIVDFGELQDIHSRIALVNIAFAPFHVSTAQDPVTKVFPFVEQDPTLNQGTGGPVAPSPAGTAMAGLRLPHPFVMAFDLTAVTTPDPSTSMMPAAGPAPSLTDLKHLTHASLPKDHGHRLVALVENPPGMLQMFELASPTPDELGRYNQVSFGAAITIRDIDHASNALVDTSYIPVSERFEDRVNFFIPYGRTDVWKILNLTVDTHPFHVHLVQFRVIERRQFNTDGYNAGMGGTAFGNPIMPSDQPSLPVDENEQGWKDTVRVNPGEMVSIAARFDGFSGRFMYHCHILEHEDHEMMRPFVVMPMEVMNLMPEMAMIDGMGGKSGKPMPPMGGM